jgi:uncharacterized protein YbjT (DUF2867 family)
MSELIAVTGASGFIGGHLVRHLRDREYKVRALVRNPDAVQLDGVEVERINLTDISDLTNNLRNIDTAYYLIHSMKDANKSFAEQDRHAAENFAKASEKAGVKRIIYLGGLGEMGEFLSEHLKSRTEVGKILQSGTVPTTVLRAAIILGPGSASWQMLRQLVERLPLMITPRWVETKCQPIALRDVLGYLHGCLNAPQTAADTFDIGGPDVLTYRQMMLGLADVLGKRRWIYGIPVLTPKLSSYWVDLVTDVPSSIARPLIDGLKNEVVCRDNRIKTYVPLTLTSYREAIALAVNEQV